MEIKHKELREVVVSSQIICDKCGKDCYEDAYCANEFTITQVIGNSYPDGNTGTKRTIDLCTNCGYDVMNILTKHGIKFTETERE